MLKTLTFASRVVGEEEAAGADCLPGFFGDGTSDKSKARLALAGESQKYNRHGERANRVQFSITPCGGRSELSTLG